MPTSVKAFFDQKVPAVLATSPEKAKDVAASDDDFRGMIDGGMQAAMSLFFSGKLKVAGDPMLATKLSKLLQMAG